MRGQAVKNVELTISQASFALCCVTTLFAKIGDSGFELQRKGLVAALEGQIKANLKKEYRDGTNKARNL